MTKMSVDQLTIIGVVIALCVALASAAIVGSIRAKAEIEIARINAAAQCVEVAP